MLPGKDGREICRDVRAKGVHVPMLRLTARGETGCALTAVSGALDTQRRISPKYCKAKCALA